MPPASFIILEVVSTVLLALGVLGLVSEPDQQPPFLSQLFGAVSPAMLLGLGIALSIGAVFVFLKWARTRRQER